MLFEPLPRNLESMIADIGQKGELNQKAIASIAKEKKGLFGAFVAGLIAAIIGVIFSGHSIEILIFTTLVLATIIVFVWKQQTYQRTKFTFLYTYGNRSEADIMRAERLTGFGFTGWEINYLYPDDSGQKIGGKLRMPLAAWQEEMPTGAKDVYGKPYVIIHHPDVSDVCFENQFHNNLYNLRMR